MQVKEAIERATKAIEEAKAAGLPKLVLITGRGVHSKDGIPKIKPAINGLIKKHNLRCTPNTPNPGCVHARA